jgi:hypothetical protein
LKYALITNKYSDFILWSEVVKLMSKGEHLTPSGFLTILSYYASINNGISPAVKSNFPNIINQKKETVKLPLNLNSHWLSGFTAGDGGFSIGIRKMTGQVYFRFHIAQHSRDVLLMNLFKTFFGCGNVNVRSNRSRCDFYVQDFSKIYDNIIPHFDNYPLFNIKSLDFDDFKKAVQLFKEDSKNNSKAIENLISNMNSKRTYY